MMGDVQRCRSQGSGDDLVLLAVNTRRIPSHKSKSTRMINSSRQLITA